jgi:hypothetical protein
MPHEPELDRRQSHKGEKETCYSYCRTQRIHNYGKQRLVINFNRARILFAVDLVYIVVRAGGAVQRRKTAHGRFSYQPEDRKAMEMP